MTSPDDEPSARLRFFGVNDLATFHLAGRAARMIEEFDAAAQQHNVGDILDLYSAEQYIAHGVFPVAYSPQQRAACEARLPDVRRAIAFFFKGINDSNVEVKVADLDWEHQDGLLELCARYEVFERCSAAVALPAFDGAGIAMAALLQHKKLVLAYDSQLRARLLADPQNAEHVVRRYLEDRTNIQYQIHLPLSFSSADARALLESYLDSEHANPNFVQLIADAPLVKEAGIDAKLKLKAKRTHQEWTTRFFQENEGVKTGCEVSISSEQTEPVVVELDGMVARFAYGRSWLEENLDYPTILNNFIYLFEFCNRHLQLTLPSYPSELGVFERFLTTKGKGAYVTGASFQLKHQSSFLQIAMYGRFLAANDVDLETVLAWFFKEYLNDQFGAPGFNFAASSKTATYLERSRHLFAETESVAKQFALYVENGEVDAELLAIGADQVRYKELPSLVDGKYVYATDSTDIQNIQYLLFSDQSGLAYINEGLRAESAAQLLISNEVAYKDFAPYQTREVDYLIGLGVLEDTGTQVRFRDLDQFGVLNAIYSFESASYYHFSLDARTQIDDMVAKGWLRRAESLLSLPEASYYNYYLNNLEFTNGPALRNKYLHGSQVRPNDENGHQNTYIVAMRLLIGLVIKINDDFWLREAEAARNGGSTEQSADM